MLYIFNFTAVSIILAVFIIHFAILLLLSKILPPNYNGMIAVIISASSLIVLDLWCRKRCKTDYESHLLKFIKPSAGGHIFFIPIWLLALPILLTGVLSPKTIDSRLLPVHDDVVLLKKNELSGDIEISRSVKQMFVSNLTEQANAINFKVFSRKNNNKILILIQTQNLNEYSRENLEAISSILEDFLKEKYPLKEYYFGFRGGFIFGVAKTPSTGRVFSDIILALATFYEEEK